MEELSVLMVLEVDVKFLVPHNASMAFYVDQFEEIRMADQIIDQDYGTK